MSDYANPHALVSTEWLERHLDDANLVVAEVDEDTQAFAGGHIPGAVGWSWKAQLFDPERRDILTPIQIEQLLGESGIGLDSIVVLYGGNNNWFAAWAYWQLKIYGHEDVRLLNGGRKKWADEGRPLTGAAAERPAKQYKSNHLNQDLRAFLPQVKMAAKGKGAALIDVRSPEEFTGKAATPAPGACQRAGHIPGAKSVPWAMTCNEDGTFKSADELQKIFADKGVTPDREVITYCGVGERSSLAWFVLKQLLGYPSVRNYDGSWTEWGNLVGVPVETGPEK